jgi:hypothetical protein
VSVAVIAAVLSLFRFQSSGSSTAQPEALKREKFLFLTRSGSYAGPGRFTALVERIETLLAAEATKWAGSMRLTSAAERDGTEAKALTHASSSVAHGDDATSRRPRGP